MKGKKTGGKDFKPGQSGNPAGRPPLPEDIKTIRSLTTVEFTRIANKYRDMSMDELLLCKTNKQLSALEHMVIAIILRGVFDGDEKALEFFLNRLIGKVPDKLAISDEQRRLEEMSDEELARLGEKSLAVLKSRSSH